VKEGGVLPMKRKDPPARPRCSWMFLLKLVGTTAILSFILSRIDLARCWASIVSSIGPWLGLGFLTYSLLLIISAHKWDQLLRALGICCSRWRLLKLYTIGFFMSSFLPGVVGGDVARWHLMGRESGRVRVAATILAERGTGLAALVFICLAIAVVVPAFATAPVLFLVLSVLTIMTAGVLLALRRRLVLLLLRGLRFPRIKGVARALQKLYWVLRKYPRGALAMAVAYSVLFYLSGGLAFFLICKSFTGQITFLEALSVRTLTCLVTMIPISIGGLGLSQAGDLYLLGILGMDPAQAIGISLTRQAIAYCYVAVGGYLFMRWKPDPVLEPVSVPVPRS
jgi:uncharacterized protein (TIRG00374 family)